MNTQQIEQAAQILHNWNRAYCTTIGNPPDQPWEQISDHDRENRQKAIRFLLQHPQASPEDVHHEWARDRTEQGWTLGAVRNEDLKTHPNLVPYGELPAAQRTKGTFARTAVEFVREMINP